MAGCPNCGTKLRATEMLYVCDFCRLFWPTEQGEAYLESVAEKWGLGSWGEVIDLLVPKWPSP